VPLRAGGCRPGCYTALLHDLGEGPCGQNDEQAALRSEIELDGVSEPHRLPLSPLAPAPMNFSGFLFEACFAAGGAEVSRRCRYERSGTRRSQNRRSSAYGINRCRLIGHVASLARWGILACGRNRHADRPRPWTQRQGAGSMGAAHTESANLADRRSLGSRAQLAGL
jgi:hypothetical protein